MNRKIFYDNIRSTLFGGALSQTQVEGINADLDYWETNHPDGNPQHLAYILATEYHESRATMLPIPEDGGNERLIRMYDITGDRPDKARELGNTQPGDGATYTGGKVQLTGRTNFRKLGKRLGVDLEGVPALIYDMKTSTAVLFVGMMDGLFTGKSLAKFTDFAGNLDAVNARRVVNGTDKAALIAGYFENFNSAIQAALIAPPPAHIQDPQLMQVTETQAISQPAPQESSLPQDWEDYQAYRAEKRRKAASKPLLHSKILLGAAATISSMGLARYGLDIPPETLVDVIQGIASGGLTLIGIFRIFFTNKPVRM